jgi:tetratricopeptide (TPR) repeat protein
MSTRLADFERLLAQHAQQQFSSVETLLAVLPPQLGELLRLCAIPHEFDTSILQVLDPKLDVSGAAQLYDELLDLACVSVSENAAMLHESARRELFARWLTAERATVFRAASARLESHFEWLAQASNARGSEVAAQQALFHALAVDQARAFTSFELLCRQARHQNRLADCGHLIKLVHEYDTVLSPTCSAWLTYHEAKLTADLLRFDDAQRLFESLLEQFDSEPLLNEQLLQIKVALRLGRLHAERRHFAKAIDFYVRARTNMLGRDRIADVREYEIARSLGEAHRDNDDLDQAEALLSHSLRSAQAAGDTAAVADIHNSWGTLQAKRGDLKDAIASYETSIAELERLGRRFQSAQVYNNLGIAQADDGEFALAEQSFRASLHIKMEAGDSLGKAKTLVNLVRVQRARKEIPAAIVACSEAIKLFREVQHYPGLADATRTLAKLHMLADARPLARDLLVEAAALFERAGLSTAAANVQEELKMVDDSHRPAAHGWFAVGCALTGVAFVLMIVVIVLEVMQQK